jgi:hypothetical protein
MTSRGNRNPAGADDNELLIAAVSRATRSSNATVPPDDLSALADGLLNVTVEAL